MAELFYAERPPAAAQPSGLLVLCHGRGSDEQDLLALAEPLDPEQRWHVVAARAPLRLPGSPGYHWYAVGRVGYPERETFTASCDLLGQLHDELWEATGLGPDRTVLGGFSQGTVMSYAMGLHPSRPAVAGILAFSGFVPTVAGWEPDLPGHRQTRVLIAHGRADPVIAVGFARGARELLGGAGLEVDYRESGAGHQIDPVDLQRGRAWLGALGAGAAPGPA